MKNYPKAVKMSPSPAEHCWLRVMNTLNEYQARLFVAEKALEMGRGGTSRLSKLTGMSRVTISSGMAELLGGKRLRDAGTGRVRAPGGGRKKVEEANPALHRRLKAIVEERTAGDPMSPLKWTSKSTRTIAEDLARGGHPVSNVTVARCLAQMGYTLQANVKTREGPQHPDRDAQFRYLNRQVKSFRRTGDPVISVDTKKKELVGAFKNGGLSVTVCHYPPGTSRWNKIEHRLFSFISLNWKGKPLINFETVVNLIGGTHTKTGLKVKAILDTNQYETGVELSKKDMDQLRLTRHKIHPDWNYTLSPRRRN